MSRESKWILKIRLHGNNPQVTQTTLELPPKTSDTNNKKTVDKSGDPRGIRAVKREQLAQIKYFEGNPKAEPSKFSGLDTVEKPAQANMQVVEIKLVKINNTN